MILSSFWRRVLGMSDKPKIVDALGAYQASNILGTVSQNGGIPTGAIIESGSNANGEYVKYADGTMICKSVAFSQTADQAVGSVFRSPTDASWTFPATFAAVPAVSGSAGTAARWLCCYSVDATSAAGRCYSGSSAATNANVYMIAVGRWF